MACRRRSPHAKTGPEGRVGPVEKRDILPKNADPRFRETGGGGGGRAAHSPPPNLGREAAQLCQSPMGRGTPEPATPSGRDQFYSPPDSPAKSSYVFETARATPRGRDPWVALAVECNNPSIVWGICHLYNSSIPPWNCPPDDIAISVPFLVDTGADVTVIPETSWPPRWKLEEASMVGGVRGLSRA